MANILVFIDAPVAAPGKAQRELLALAARLGTPVAAVARPVEDDVVVALGAHGAATVYTAPTDLGDSLVADKAAFVAAVAEASAAAAVLLPNTFEGKEIAARAGVKLSAGVITDAIDVAPDLTVTKSVLAGSHTVAARSTQGVLVATVKPNSIEPAEADGGAPARATVDIPDAGPAARVTAEQERPASGRPDLQDARVVVAGGRGTDGDFGPVEELADALGGAVGASRAATDAGWIDHSFQVGQTGKTVSPQLYISAGISGAVQQKAGMQTAKVVVAINKDADAPIFEIADFGIVGDLNQVLPQAAAEIKRRRG
jgi:electron transfer flavoprotein alpha subunit